VAWISRGLEERSVDYRLGEQVGRSARLGVPCRLSARAALGSAAIVGTDCGRAILSDDSGLSCQGM
jgi:hypothetical protein